jgi:hypothetical protein
MQKTSAGMQREMSGIQEGEEEEKWDIPTGGRVSRERPK